MTSPLIKDVNLFLDDKPSVFALRQKAKTTLLQTGFPTKKTEAWKYTNIDPIIKSDFFIETKNQECDHKCDHQKNSSTFIDIHFCNGKLHIEDFSIPDGMTIIPLPVALYDDDYKKYFFHSFDLEKHPFAALNGAYLEQGVCVCVEKNKKISQPILIKYAFDCCEKQQLNIHNLFILEKNAELTIIEDFLPAKNSSHLTNVVNEIFINNNAHFEHYKKQKESPLAYHLTLNAAKIKQQGFYKQVYFSDGAKISRKETLINLEQSNAKAEIFSAYKAKKDSLTDITTNINHLVENTKSNQYAKAVLEENSNATFQGKIFIAPNAVKSSGEQLHKALYLADTANLNCKPELEIYADDVTCSHGASCGEIDKEQLFYLQSRAINKNTALEMLTKAHLEEIFTYISDEKIKDLFSI